MNGTFSEGAGKLLGWTVSDPALVTVNAGNEAVIRESAVDHVVTLFQDFLIPAGAESLSFQLHAFTFDDRVEVGMTPDAFGVALLNATNLVSLVPTVDAVTDSFYIQDIVPGGRAGELGAGVTATPTGEPGTFKIQVNLESLAGQPARLVFRVLGGSDGTQWKGSATVSAVEIRRSGGPFPPVANAGPDRSVPEGLGVNLQGTFTEEVPVTGQTFRWRVLAADGAVVHEAATQDTTFLPVDDGVFSAVFTVTDANGAGSDTAVLSVTNVAPILTLSGAAVVDEGSGYTLELASSDLGADTITGWKITWGDGAMDTVVGNASSATHTYLDGPNAYTISAEATDEDGTFPATNTVSVSVLNVAPAVTLSGAPDVGQGTPYILSLSASDPGADAITQWLIVWGDGTTQTEPGTSTTIAHTYLTGPGPFTLSAEAVDEDGTHAGANTLSVRVTSEAPTLTLSGAAEVNEGAPYTLNLAASGPGAETIAEWNITWGDGATETVPGDPGSVSHTYLDGPSDRAITARAVVAGRTFEAGNALSVSVKNVAPTLTLSGAAEVTKGATYTLNLASSDPGTDTIVQWVITWGDGATETVIGQPTSVTHVYAEGPNTRTITAEAMDEDGTYPAGNSLSVTVNDSPATLTLTLDGAAEVNEGAPYTLNLSASGPGADAITTWTLTWGDGTTEAIPGLSTSATHTFTDGPANATITARATVAGLDYDANNNLSVSVKNVAPTLTLSGAAEVTQGATYTLNLASSDPGTDTIVQWVITWGDGATETVIGQPTSVTHVYAEGSNTRTITGEATDEDGTYPAGNLLSVTVKDTPLTLTAALSGAAEADEGAPYTLDLLASGPGADAITTWTITWGDGVTETVPGTSTSATHTYPDGPSTSIITAEAVAGGLTYPASNTVLVSVRNVAPKVTVEGPEEVNEGAPYTLSLATSDPGADTVAEWTIAWGDGVTETIRGHPAAATHTYADGPNLFVINAGPTDEDGSYPAGKTLSVTVKNVAPTLTLSGPGDVNEGVPYTLTLASSDPGTDTIHGWTITWGDGTSETVDGNPALVRHTYLDGPNRHTISAQATDEDGDHPVANTLSVNVMDVPPILTLSGAAEVNEGAPYTLTLASSDPGTDTITSWTINWGDGTTETLTGNPTTATHTYAQGPDRHTVTAQATNEDGVFDAVNAVALDVLSLVRTVTLRGDPQVREGASYVLTLDFAGDLPAGVAGWQVLWGDGTSDALDPSRLTLTHVYPDGPSSFEISVEARVEATIRPQGNILAVAVLDVPPTIELLGEREVDEGAAYVLTLGEVSDPGEDTVTQFVVHWGDGTQDTYSDSGAVTHTYADGPWDHTITVDLVDEDGRHFDADAKAGSGDVSLQRVDGQFTLHWGGGGVLQVAEVIDGAFADVIGAPNPYPLTNISSPKFYRVLRSHAVHVRDVSPRIELQGDRRVAEGAPYVLNLGRIIDPGIDTVREYIVHWGDGLENAYATGGDVTHIYADGPADRTITVDLVDEDGLHPDADVKAASDLLTVRFEGSHFILDWQGGGTLQAVDQVEQWFQDVPEASSPYSPVTLRSEQFFRLLRSHPVHVTDVSPTIELSGAREVDEGSVYTLTLGAVHDPGTDSVSDYLVAWGDGTEDRYPQGGPVTHVYGDGPADRTITVDLVDEDGRHPDADIRAGTIGLTLRRGPGGLTLEWDAGGVLQVASQLDGSFRDLQSVPNTYQSAVLETQEFFRVLRSHPVRVNDVVPNIRVAGTREARRGLPYLLTLGDVQDPGADHVSAYVVRWGDGAQDVYLAPGEVTHSYATAPAEHTITVDLINEDGTHVDAGVLFGNPELTIRRSDQALLLEWGSGGVLQAADSGGGPFRDVPFAVSPLTLNPDHPWEFYRVLRSLSVSVKEGGLGISEVGPQ